MKVLGDWTQKLLELAQKKNANTGEASVSIFFEGPYGNPQVDVEGSTYDHFVLISGGIGVTPMLTTAAQLMEQCQRQRPLELCWFVWSVREPALVDAVFHHVAPSYLAEAPTPSLAAKTSATPAPPSAAPAPPTPGRDGSSSSAPNAPSVNPLVADLWRKAARPGAAGEGPPPAATQATISSSTTKVQPAWPDRGGDVEMPTTTAAAAATKMPTLFYAGQRFHTEVVGQHSWTTALGHKPPVFTLLC